MKRLYIITELFPPDETSTSYILGEIANTCTSEYEVFVICGPEIYDSNKKFDVNHPFVLNKSIIVKRVGQSITNKRTKIKKALSLISMSVKLYKLAKHSIKKGDKVLLVTNPAPLVLLIAHLRKRIKFDFILLVHDVFPENLTLHNLHLPKFIYNRLKRASDKAYGTADKLIALGRDMKIVLQKKIGKDKIINVVENWADTENIKPIPFPQSDSIIVEYAGNMGKAQGLERIITSLPEGVELHLYGTGAMENILRSMDHPRVFFHGPYFRSQQEQILGSCHASIVSLSDGMYGIGVPSKSYNIMASGRPIIFMGPSNSEIALTIIENKIGYIDWPNKWDNNEMVEMGCRARILAETVFSKQTILEKFLNAIR